MNQYKNKIIYFYKKNRRMPTYSEMMVLFDLKSKNSVSKIVDKMINGGLILKDKIGKLIPGDSFNSIPLLGSIKAGFPSNVEEISNSLSIENYLIKDKEETYLLEVDGDSMIDAHIKDGDIVIAQKANTANNDEIVIAQIDGEFTMKYLKKDGDKLWLQPANKLFKPMYPKYQFEIIAVIKGVIRKY